MPRTAATGAYAAPSSSWNPAVDQTVIDYAAWNTLLDDIETALSTASASTRALWPLASQVQDGGLTYLTSVAGTNTITAVGPISLAAYAAGQQFRFVSAGANTGATTININSIGAKSVTKFGARALAAGEIPSGVVIDIIYDGTQFVMIGALPDEQSMIENASLSVSVAANAMTIALKTAAAADPSATNPVRVAFRNATLATGDYTVVSVVAATSLVVSSGSTLGTSSGIMARLWVVAFNDGGTFRLGVINCKDSSHNIYSIADNSIASSTAEGGAGGADSAGVIYTGTAVTSKAMRVLGFIEISQAAAGTWASSVTKTQMYAPDIALPGARIQLRLTQTGTLATGSTAIPADNTIPQSTEGDQYMSQAITPSNAVNVLRIDSQFYGGSNNTGQEATVALFQDSTADALKAISFYNNLAGPTLHHRLRHVMTSGTASATTFKIRAGQDGAFTLSFNGYGGAQRFGGVANSFISVEEIMA